MARALEEKLRTERQDKSIDRDLNARRNFRPAPPALGQRTRLGEEHSSADFGKEPRKNSPFHNHLRSSDSPPLHASRFAELGSRPRFRHAWCSPLYSRNPSHDVPHAPLDDAPVSGLWHRGSHQRTFPLPPFARPDRPLHSLRPTDSDGL